MGEINEADTAIISKAVIAWTGWGQTMTPRRDDAEVISLFGVEVAARLLPILRTLARDFYSTNARFIAKDTSEMGALASEQFRARHPDLPPVVAKSFAWCYTFDYK